VEVVPFAGNFAPGGWAFCEGQLLAVIQNTELFAKLGNTYGGNGPASFALPDLRGRTVVHAGQGTGLTNRMLGESFGVENVTLTQAQMRSHHHSLPFDGNTTSTGGSQPFTNMQPSLVMNYGMPINAPYPVLPTGTAQTPFLSQVQLFAGTMLPAGYAAPNGQLLNGQTNFALPDLRGRTIIGAGQGPGLSNRSVGEEAGVESLALSVGQLPPHMHDYVPEPSTTLLFALATLCYAWRRRRSA
jgi:microcystin-dependent protein